MKTGFKYLGLLLLVTVVLSGVFAAVFSPRDSFSFGTQLANFVMVYLGIPVFVIGLWVQSRRNKRVANASPALEQKHE